MTTRPRILLDARGTQDGFKAHRRRGVGYYARHLLDALSRRTDVFEPMLLLDDRLPVDYDTGPARRILHRSLKVPSAAIVPESQFTLPGTIRTCGADITHFLAHEDGCIYSSAPSIVTVHDTIPVSLGHLYTRWQRIKRRPVEAIGSSIIRRASSIIVVSERTRADVMSVYGVPEAKITVTHLAADASYSTPPSLSSVQDYLRAHGLPGRYILYVGGIDPRKNIPRLLEAFAMVVREGFQGLTLVHAGSLDGQREYPAMMEAISRLAISDNVRLVGYVPDEDLPLLYAGSTGFVFPSLLEGFGLPVLQAMSAGTPVITTRRGSIPEVGGDAVLYVDPTDIREIAGGILAILSNQDLRGRLRLAGLKRAKLFSWERTASETIAVYQRVYSQTRSGHGRNR